MHPLCRLRLRLRLQLRLSLLLLLLLLPQLSSSSLHPSWSGSSSSSSFPDSTASASSGFSYKSSYSRFPDTRDHCKPYLSSDRPRSAPASENDARKWTVINELTFLNGEWLQTPGKKPLMPFVPTSDGNDSTNAGSGVKAENLVSLWVTDVDADSSTAGAVNVSVVLQVGVSSERALSYMNGGLEGFQAYPGFSLLGLLMEGLYAETEGGDRVLCLLGSGRLPVRGNNASDPWYWLPSISNGSLFSPPLREDDQIKAVVRFPKELTLTSRAVSGTLQSLRDASSDSSFFDSVAIGSQLGAYSNYEYTAGDMARKACSSNNGVGVRPAALPKKLYQGGSFCTVVQEILTGQWVDILPNWNCSISNITCVKFGPFSSAAAFAAVDDGGFNGTQLLVQDIRCSEEYSSRGGPSAAANMSAVIRAVLPSQNKNLAFERTNLDGLTLAAEGKWDATTGELCMVGCIGGEAGGGDRDPAAACDTRISMFIPLSLSLKQRSILKGTISTMTKEEKEGGTVFYPLSFHLPLYSLQLPPEVVSNITYEYSKLKEAGVLLDKYEPTGFGEQIKKSVLEYPSAEGNILELFDDLSLRSLAITNPDSMKGPHTKQYVELDVVAIQDRVKLHWTQPAFNLNDTFDASVDASDNDDSEPAHYNVAAQLKVKDNDGNKIAAIDAEGLYDPASGQMFLVGCRQVNLPWEVLQESEELLDEGLDCRIEFRVNYPPTNARLFMNPTVMLTVTSRRPSDDPLFFEDVKLETFPILYKRQRQEIVSRKSLEGGLSMLTLSLILGCLIGQLIYVKSHSESTPYISLLMLAVQGVGFSIPLITGVEALFARMTSDQDDDMRQIVLNEGKWTHAIGYMVNLLTLAAFLLTLRIMQKVYKSRLRLLSRNPLQPWKVPNDKKVILICLAVHFLGFLLVLAVHSIRIRQSNTYSSMYMDWHGGLHKQYDWERILKEYYGLVQDLFLLPQVVGNHIWVVRGKPLRSLFYVGVTVLRLLPHVYDTLRPSVFNPYFSDEFQYANPSSDFYSKAGDIGIPLLAIALAVVVYVQQRWNGLKWEKVLRQGSNKLLRMGSKMYERLPSKTFEAEMVESVAAATTAADHEKGDAMKEEEEEEVHK